MDSRHLVDTWLVCVTVLEPAVSRAFKISLPVGGAKPTSKVRGSVSKGRRVVMEI